MTLVDRLFMRFAAIYGHKWNTAFPSERAISIAKREWSETINRLSLQQLKTGIDFCKNNLQWPPSLPEFVNACQQDDSLPSLNAAFREACNASSEHPWSHPVVYYTAKDIGIYSLRTEPERYTKPQFERAYEIYLRRFKNGEQLEIPVPKGLPQKAQNKASPETAAKYMAKIRKILEGKHSNEYINA